MLRHDDNATSPQMAGVRIAHDFAIYRAGRRETVPVPALITLGDCRRRWPRLH